MKHASIKFINLQEVMHIRFMNVATALTELSEKEVKYTSVEIPAFEEIMKQKGLPDGMINYRF